MNWIALKVELVAVLAVLVTLSSKASGEEVEQVGESTWRIGGDVEDASTNSVVFAGSESTLLVDPGRTPAEVVARIAQAEALSGSPVREVLLTSVDSGLGALLVRNREFQVTCHEETRRALVLQVARRLEQQRESARTPEEAATLDPRNLRLPDRMLVRTERKDLGGHSLRILHMPGARTEGDLVVFSRQDRAIAGGELAFVGSFPMLTATADLREWIKILVAFSDASDNKLVGARGAAIPASDLVKARTYLADLVRGAESLPEVARGWSGGSTFEQNQQRAAAYAARLAAESERELFLFPAVQHEPGETREHDPDHPRPAGWSQRFSELGLVAELADETLSLRELESGEESGRVNRVDTGGLDHGAAISSDGRLLYVPAAKSGRVLCYDLFNHVLQSDALVGGGPGWGGFTRGDVDFVLPVQSKSSLVFINTASREVSALLHEGLRPRPAGVAVAPDGRHGLVWYDRTADSAEAGNEVSLVTVVDLIERQILGEGTLPHDVMSLAFDAVERKLWVEADGWPNNPSVVRTHGKFIDYHYPESWDVAATTGGEKRQVAVMGMTHSGHVESELWGLEEVADTIRRYKPDAVLVEIPPNRWQKAWDDYCLRGVIEESRVRVFPEYRDMMFDLAAELGFEIVPCAAWTTEMNDLRRERLRQFRDEERWSESREKLATESAEVEARWKDSPVHGDDPHVIHSAEYDRHVREVMDPVGRHQNELVGLGGWYNINRAHMELVHEAIDARPGQRLLVTFGAYHKYMFLEELRSREDVELLELGPYLPAK